MGFVNKRTAGAYILRIVTDCLILERLIIGQLPLTNEKYIPQLKRTLSISNKGGVHPLTPSDDLVEWRARDWNKQVDWRANQP